MTKTNSYRCEQCGNEDRDALRGVRALRPCPQCNDITTWVKI